MPKAIPTVTAAATADRDGSPGESGVDRGPVRARMTAVTPKAPPSPSSTPTRLPEAGDRDRFRQELHQDVSAPRPGGLADPDLARSLGHRCQQDVHDPDPAHQQGDAGDGAHQQLEDEHPLPGLLRPGQLGRDRHPLPPRRVAPGQPPLDRLLGGLDLLDLCRRSPPGWAAAVPVPAPWPDAVAAWDDRQKVASPRSCRVTPTIVQSCASIRTGITEGAGRSPSAPTGDRRRAGRPRRRPRFGRRQESTRGQGRRLQGRPPASPRTRRRHGRRVRPGQGHPARPAACRRTPSHRWHGLARARGVGRREHRVVGDRDLDAVQLPASCAAATSMDWMEVVRSSCSRAILLHAIAQRQHRHQRGDTHHHARAWRGRFAPGWPGAR